MKNIFQAHSTYNFNSNSMMISVLEDLPKEMLFKKTGAYYMTIYETLLHIFLSNDLFFLKLFAEIFPGDKELEDNRFTGMDETGYMNFMSELNNDYRLVFRHISDLGNIIRIFTGKLDETMLESTIDSYDDNGEPVKTKLWITLLALFSHQIHHRGQISAFLDQSGVENNFSVAAWE